MRAFEIFNLLARRYPQVAFPPRFLSFIQEQEANGHQIRRADSGQPLLPFLAGLGVSPALTRALFDRHSRVIMKLSFPALLESPADELQRRLVERFSPLFTLQEEVLNSETLTGFNRHGQQHLATITRRMLALLRRVRPQALSSPRARNEAIIAGYLHDSGNIISRRYHGLYGAYLLTQFCRDFARDEETLESFRRVLEAVLFHEVEFGLRLPSLSLLHPVALALIIADKTDVSFRRVSPQSNVPGAISDAHILVNLLATRSRVRCRGKSFRWELYFSPKVEAEGAALFPRLLKRTERVWVPQSWQRLYREDNIEYIFVFNATFLRLYLSRLLFTIRAVFALSPAIERFHLVINDKERGVSLHRLFTRADYQEKIALIGKNLFKHDWEGAEIFQVLRQNAEIGPGG